MGLPLRRVVSRAGRDWWTSIKSEVGLTLAFAGVLVRIGQLALAGPPMTASSIAACVWDGKWVTLATVLVVLGLTFAWSLFTAPVRIYKDEIEGLRAKIASIEENCAATIALMPTPEKLTTVLVRERDRYLLCVKNDGPPAEFWGTWRLTQDVKYADIDIPNHEVMARWDHTPGQYAHIATGESHRIVIGSVVGPMEGSGLIQWFLPHSYSDTDDDAQVTFLAWPPRARTEEMISFCAVRLEITLFAKPGIFGGPLSRVIQLRGGMAVGGGATANAFNLTGGSK